MPAPLQITGQRFGRLVAVSLSEKRYANGGRVWLCACDCGVEKAIAGRSLVSGATRSCGCFQAENRADSAAKDISGQKFSRLSVVRPTGRTAAGRGRLWVCRCECGAEVEVAVGSLTTGNTQSCGCLNRARVSAASRLCLTGRVFGKLIAEEEIGQDSAKNYLWRCACSCGAEKTVRASHLTAGRVISCGCARQDSTVYMPAHARATMSAKTHRRRTKISGAGGSFTVEEVEALYVRQKGKCGNMACRVKLGRSFDRDHNHPVDLGGTSDIRNIVLLCVPCNRRKSNKHPIDWAQENGLLL
jgi:hypothetical protein